MSEWISVKEQMPVGEPRLLYVVHSPAEDTPPRTCSWDISIA